MGRCRNHPNALSPSIFFLYGPSASFLGLSVTKAPVIIKILSAISHLQPLYRAISLDSPVWSESPYVVNDVPKNREYPKDRLSVRGQSPTQCNRPALVLMPQQLVLIWTLQVLLKIFLNNLDRISFSTFK